MTAHFSLFDNAKIANVLSPASRSSAATGDYVSMANYNKCTMLIKIGANTAGGNITLLEAKTAAGGSAATLNFDYFYQRTASTDTWTKTADDQASSASCITIGNSEDGMDRLVEITGDMLTDGFKFVTVATPAAFSAQLCDVTAILTEPRYAGNATMPSALA
jgi:hypothetical protein